MVVGRFAPSPTGPLHLGSALAALAAWVSARGAGGRFVYRIEDLDGPRVVAGAAQEQLETLRWLGLDWDEGPDIGGPHAPYRQSERADIYAQALLTLAQAGRLFPCRRSRKDLHELASAPHGRSGLPPYPREWRPTILPPDWLTASDDCALRFAVQPGVVTFHDRVMGVQNEDVSQEVGDFVLKRRDGVFAYQLAVVVDDIEMGINEVVRGADLLDSTARQIQLFDALQGDVPAFAHVPLLVTESGEKLSKRDGAMAIETLSARGARSTEIIGLLAYILGLQPTNLPVSARDLIQPVDWSAIRKEPFVILPGLLPDLY